MPAAHPDVASALGRVRASLRALRHTLDLRRSPPDPLPVVVGCSGGPDSVALLGLLARLARREPLALSVAHVDHGLRADSGDDADHVVDLAASLGLVCAVRRLELDAGSGLAVRARDARRQALVTIADRMHASVVALAHTATDQAETLLLNLVRGTGARGLSGMKEVQPWNDPAGARVAWLWRPMLGIDRDAARRIADALGLPVRDDPTNLDPRHPRVRMRLEVLPQLRAMRDGVDLAIARAAAQLGEADAAIEQLAAGELASRRCVGSSPIEPTRYRSVHWAEITKAVRTRMIRRVCERDGVPSDALSARTIASIDDALASDGAGPWTWDLHPRRQLRAEGGRFWVHVPNAE